MLCSIVNVHIYSICYNYMVNSSIHLISSQIRQYMDCKCEPSLFSQYWQIQAYRPMRQTYKQQMTQKKNYVILHIPKTGIQTFFKPSLRANLTGATKWETQTWIFFATHWLHPLPTGQCLSACSTTHTDDWHGQREKEIHYSNYSSIYYI